MYDNNDENDRMSNNPIVIIAGVLGVILAVIILIFTWLSMGPEGGVRMINEMEEYALEYIEEHEILNDTEKIVAYYDRSRSLDGTEAAILTSERIVYHKKSLTMEFNLNDIADVKHRYEEFDGDIIEIMNREGKFMKIMVAPDFGGESFYNALIGLLEVKGIELR